MKKTLLLSFIFIQFFGCKHDPLDNIDTTPTIQKLVSPGVNMDVLAGGWRNVDKKNNFLIFSYNLSDGNKIGFAGTLTKPPKEEINNEDYEDSSMTTLTINIVGDSIYCKYSPVNSHVYKDGKINLIGNNFIVTPVGNFKKLFPQEYNKEFSSE